MSTTARSRAAVAVLEVLSEHACTISADLSLGERIAVRDELLAIEKWLQARAADKTISRDAVGVAVGMSGKRYWRMS